MKLEGVSPSVKANTVIVLYANGDQRVPASSIECDREPCGQCELYRGRYNDRSKGKVEIFCLRGDFLAQQTVPPKPKTEPKPKPGQRQPFVLPIPPDELPAAISRYREATGVSQTKLSIMLGVSLSYVSKLEAGRANNDLKVTLYARLVNILLANNEPAEE